LENNDDLIEEKLTEIWLDFWDWGNCLDARTRVGKWTQEEMLRIVRKHRDDYAHTIQKLENKIRRRNHEKKKLEMDRTLIKAILEERTQ